MSHNEGNWCLIESDPGVFTELIKEFGCSGVEVEELWGLEAEQFETLKPVHGLIFLFKWLPDDEPAGSIVKDSRLEKIFFAKQVINNACATQAILSILLNCKHPDLHLGKTLTDFRDFTHTFDANMKGLALSNAQGIREVHNSFARQTLFEFDNKAANKDEDVFHFVGYVPIEGRLYELDGLKEGPVDLGALPADTDWVDVVRPIIQKRINKYNEGEIHFNLMAVISDKKLQYEKRLQQLQKQIDDGGMETDTINSEMTKLRLMIENEENKVKRYKSENIRRKHNYLPLIVEILKMLAREGQLLPLYEKAKAKAAEKEEKKLKT
ncbi:ubiquitin carboxyl-terminal hydrolase isozyme L5 [Cimex lectularius]|uniref:Ubiquitin carboxyl-terminal hydrolase n=1 Tax=Cimex lectularius TaxID=79782 RepID=A0A8I6TMN9_CIMLE|nr:ubiquitin carboxyl-terminal hydrolase isozyme L5 [Cimex lectularius]XP_024084689.1 ubiquitin carboxyl-terminal hydrolase isozyme L5 [Cimex lectularius]